MTARRLVWLGPRVRSPGFRLRQTIRWLLSNPDLSDHICELLLGCFEALAAQGRTPGGSDLSHEAMDAVLSFAELVKRQGLRQNSKRDMI
jgi:hypothetical protein